MSYIEREKALDAVLFALVGTGYQSKAIYAIKDVPTADVEEVRHSQIKRVNRPISAQYATVTDENGEKHYGKVCDRIENNPVGYCGECGKRLDDTFMNYCPNCGAKMDGERSEK